MLLPSPPDSRVFTNTHHQQPPSLSATTEKLTIREPTIPGPTLPASTSELSSPDSRCSSSSSSSQEKEEKIAQLDKEKSFEDDGEKEFEDGIGKVRSGSWGDGMDGLGKGVVEGEGGQGDEDEGVHDERGNARHVRWKGCACLREKREREGMVGSLFQG